MIIFRMQDRQGRGPSKERKAEEVIGTGCQKIQQLRRWFDRSEYTTLRILGYHAVKMTDVRPLRQSNKQVVFCRGKPLNRDVEIIELYEH